MIAIAAVAMWKFSGREQPLVRKEEDVPSTGATKTIQPHQSCKSKARE